MWLALVDSVSAELICPRSGARLAAAEADVTKALSVVPNHAVAHLRMGVIQIYTNRAARGLAECEQCVTTRCQLMAIPRSHRFRKDSLGRAEETEAHVHEAFRLSPRDQFSYLWMHFIGMANIFLGGMERRLRGCSAALRLTEITLSVASMLAAARLIAAIG